MIFTESSIDENWKNLRTPSYIAFLAMDENKISILMMILAILF